MQVMRRWRLKKTCTVVRALPCIFYGGPEEDTGHLHFFFERDEAFARVPQ